MVSQRGWLAGRRCGLGTGDPPGDTPWADRGNAMSILFLSYIFFPFSQTIVFKNLNLLCVLINLYTAVSIRYNNYIKLLQLNNEVIKVTNLAVFIKITLIQRRWKIWREWK